MDIRATIRPALLVDHPHCKELGSNVEELNLYTSHVHTLFAQDNANLYARIEQGLKGTSYSSAIIPICRAHNDKAAMDSVVSQFSGKAVWELRIKKSLDYFMNRKWTGTTNQTLKAHIDRHITSFVAMTEASDHVSYQIPNDRTRVGYLIASITSAETNVVSAPSSICMDDMGRRENFETASVFLAKICLMVSTKGGAKPAAKIGAALAQQNSVVGTTGVELRYHTQAQRGEVSEYKRTKNPNWKGKSKG